MKNTKLIIKTKSKSYPIYFGENTIKITGVLVKKNLPGIKKICIIVDNNLPKKLLKTLANSLKNYKVFIYKIPATEKIKSLEIAKKIIEYLLNKNFNRTDCVIAFGGGVIGDLSSFVANLTKRGLRFINIPTTLLAQVDASIGGKTGINTNLGKNLIGTFYQPDFIISDVLTLKSLPQREIISGYGEVLKHSLILDKKFFLWLVKNGKNIIYKRNKIFLKLAIIKSCKIKCSIVNKDEKEKNLRMILNFGHTFAHGFEGATNFSKKINHGEAVLLGMMMACELSNINKNLETKELFLIKKHYLDLNLPMKINSFFKKKQIKKIIYFMKNDKKNVNEKINLILLKKIGMVSKPGEIVMSSEKVEKFLYSHYK